MQQVLRTTTSASSIVVVFEVIVGHEELGEPFGVVLVDGTRTSG